MKPRDPGNLPLPTERTDDGSFRLLVEGVLDYAIYLLDPAGNVVTWNSGAERFKGYAAEEIIGSHFSRFYGEEDRRDGLPARALDIALREGSFENEGWRVRKDGTRFWAHVVMDPIRGPDGTLLGFAKVTRDLTKRRAAEEQLRRSQEEFRLLVQSVTDYGIYMLDPEGNVATWNAGAQRIKGYTEEEIVGQHFSRFYTEEDRAAGAPQRALATALHEGRFENEAWRVRKDGTRFWASIVIDPVREPDGTLRGFAKVTRDITERREALLELERAREALFQSQKMEAIGQLTGGVAHDFNNLLTAVIGSLELVRKRLPPDEKNLLLIDNAMQAARRGAALTQRMLAFARRHELDPELASVAALVSGMTTLFDHTLGPSMVLDVDCPASLAPVRVDVNQLEMALLNLVVNARDAMPRGGTIAITARELAAGPASSFPLPAGRYVRLSVRDHGHGMDATTLARATEPFFTTKGVGKGTGLGLSMVHGLAEQLGGRLQLESAPGAGTTASLWIPVAGGDDVPSQQRGEPAPAPGAAPLHILAVDDDALILVNTAAMLEDLGHEVTTAYSGREALAALARLERVDLVVTDQAMPGMTGTELAAELRREHPGLPVLLATGYAGLAEGGMSDLPRLNKPFLQAHLDRAIAEVMRGRSRSS
ncbi:PAS domain-containing sensor histidine kinase [Reyranella sp.]|jgi:PAS domain S-box-containing protein|uniref:hybrid sensor histidine kinase/response regulator n=1 Tax=Reyranella sp. TaxID=1929291 RepID=UPI000BC9848D|nr:PAS domain-containing sensor histidine kinase [Reyranella sp.]OYY36236.1 MAG: hybrid sensor histidine kinase/response regulator [Rhodospirillales bacterium 35-66-84]OYZ91147.1 MAG: hybrid sensor histidine kinase/response regulator [Rhodospirillales bacterium 24-66-33]OZB22643.1 MAG: hybrid sensor histidine kinase/response regulator [Rhodospirillales bacterium 39-66-50]HQS18683.1 PAS domain S-box protein [Reyranella sp.]HQT15193.1 PAS domain S-box protein [Reyranella sp.]